ncbi:MAG: PAS domain S-box protein [Desulfobacteraceae bacterium]|jgi:PAS domain S-box-containing protein
MTTIPAHVYVAQRKPEVDNTRTNTFSPEKDPNLKIQEWQSAFDNVNDAVWILSNDERILYANSATEKIFRLSTAEMMGKQFWGVLYCKENRVKECPGRLAKHSHTREEIELKIRNKWIRITADPILNADGSYIGSIFIARTIIEKKQYEKALHEVEYKYHMLFDKMLNAFALHEIICDEYGKPVDYRYLELNPAYERITGLEISNTLGRTALEIWPDIDPFLIQRYGEVALTGKPNSFNFFNRYTSQHYIITVYQPEERKFACFLQDITEQKQAEQALRKSEKNLKKARDELEQRVHDRTEELEEANKILKKKTKKLEDVNTALRVLLENREIEKEENGEKILLNVKEFLIPYIEKLKNGPLTENQKKYLKLLDSGLKEIMSPFARKLTSRYMNITPRELQVANLVKDGKTSKEIAEIFHTTERTVVFHRTNLREKLGLKKKANLRTYLLSLRSETPSPI